MERGLSKNTLMAYRSDLYSFVQWLSQLDKNITQTQSSDLLGYLAAQGSKSARTTARRLSSLRRLFQYLLREGQMTDDPTTLIESPRLGRPLPKSMTEIEVEQLLMADAEYCGYFQNISKDKFKKDYPSADPVSALNPFEGYLKYNPFHLGCFLGGYIRGRSSFFAFYLSNQVRTYL